MTRLDGDDTEIEEPKDMRNAKGGKGLIHRLSTRRIIPEGDEVSRVLRLRLLETSSPSGMIFCSV